ncbi:MAG: biopolymer transporter ExbD [Byssovorax sp.]
MSSSIRNRRFKVLPAGEPNSSINITPLVDVVLVMLIIFMVVTPLLEKDIDVRVPTTEQVETTTDVPPDQLLVKLSPQGDILVNGDVVKPEDYVPKLADLLKKKRANDKIVFVAADDASNYGRVVTLLDGAKQAGAETIGMATEVPSATPNAGAPPAPPPAPPAPPSPP